MSTPHIAAEMGDFAKTVLMPGDPLRAQFIAETFLQDVRQVTGVRGMLGFTGTYEGRPISVMGSGMGMPSIGIYSYELFKFYGVENIVRIGSAGSYTDKAKLFDVVLAAGAVSESSYARTQSGFEGHITFPSRELNEKLRASAAKLGIPLIEGNIHSSDVFYRQPSDAKPTYWEKLRDEQGCVCVEMERFALFANAQVLGKPAACLLTISDSFVSPEATTAERRQKIFTNMMHGALGADSGGRPRHVWTYPGGKTGPDPCGPGRPHPGRGPLQPLSGGGRPAQRRRPGLYRLQHRKRSLHPHQLRRAHRPVLGGQPGGHPIHRHCDRGGQKGRGEPAGHRPLRRLPSGPVRVLRARFERHHGQKPGRFHRADAGGVITLWFRACQH